MQILNPVFQPATGFLPACGTDLSQSRTVRAQKVRNDYLRATVLTHRFLKEFQCGLLVACLRDKAFEDFALMINGTPKIVPLAVNFHEHLIQMPAPHTKFNTGNPPFSDLRGKHWTKRCHQNLTA